MKNTNNTVKLYLCLCKKTFFTSAKNSKVVKIDHHKTNVYNLMIMLLFLR